MMKEFAEFACNAALSLAAEYAGKEIKNKDVVKKCIANYAKQCNYLEINASASHDNNSIVVEVECTVAEFARSIGQLTYVLKQFGEVKIVYREDRIRVNITVDLC